MKKLLKPALVLLVILTTVVAITAIFYFRQKRTPQLITKELDYSVFAGEKLDIVFAELTFEADSELPGFISLEPSIIHVAPSSSEVGNYVLSLHAYADEQPYLIHINLTVNMPPVDFSVLQTDVETLIADFAGEYSIYVYDLRREQGFAIAGEKEKAPASISKIPYALLTLKRIDDGTYTLDYNYPISSRNKAYSSDLMYYFANGRKTTLDEYMSYLIRESDNTAMQHLEAIHGGLDSFNEQIASELGISYLNRQPHRTSANATGEVLTKIYRQELLAKEQNDILLNYMKTTNDKYADRIVAGVPQGVEVAHKIGNDVYSTGLIYNDAGIVYGELTDFVIVVLGDQVSSTTVGGREIAEITKLVYNQLN